MKMIGGVEV